MVEFTGERLVPGQADPDLFNEHMSRYAFSARLAHGRRVLDIACGMGYGSAALAKVASSVVGLDVSEAAAAAARRLYAAPNLSFVAAAAQQIPFADSSFDLIVAFEVIEHLEEWPALLAEARRLLAPGGQFVLSTPNKEYYAETRRIAGPNPYHVHEFEYGELHAALGALFPSVALFLQNHVEAIAFQPASGGGAMAAELAPERALAEPASSHFFLAVCALAAQTGSPTYLYLPASTNVLREREQHIAKLGAELAQKDRWLEKLKSDLAELHEQHQRQAADLEKKTLWAQELDRQLESSQARVVDLQREIEEEQKAAAATVAAYEEKIRQLEGDLAARDALARSFEAELQTKIEELGRSVELLHAAEATVEERTAWVRQLEERIRHLEQTLQSAQSSRWVRLGRTFGVGPDLQKF